jgi:hypothetical protein
MDVPNLVAVGLGRFQHFSYLMLAGATTGASTSKPAAAAAGAGAGDAPVNVKVQKQVIELPKHPLMNVGGHQSHHAIGRIGAAKLGLSGSSAPASSAPADKVGGSVWVTCCSGLIPAFSTMYWSCLYVMSHQVPLGCLGHLHVPLPAYVLTALLPVSSCSANEMSLLVVGSRKRWGS